MIYYNLLELEKLVRFWPQPLELDNLEYLIQNYSKGQIEQRKC